ncbi:phosphoglycerate mutase [Neokomagataea tanensis]|uniref:Phosphoglycerate mutase n=3 Tax=Acetobacteraceae TaxID=433 RepID=A0A4Y6VAP5_9PROT|nr:phosphoglycerate mutase [Neokomagataea tanensis]
MDGRCYGRSDVPLANGWECFADGLSVLIRGSGAKIIHVSPLLRCRLLGEYVAQKTGLPLEEDARLQEMNFGLWEGEEWSSVSRSLLREWAKNPEAFVPPEGESGKALIERVQSYWLDIRKAATGVCAITHGGPLKVLTALICGNSPDLSVPLMPKGSVRIMHGNTEGL